MKKTCLALLVRNLSKSSSCANFGSLWNTVLSHDYISKCYFSTSALSQLPHSYFTSFTFPENRTIPWKVDLQWKVNYLLFLASLFPFIMFIRILNYYIYCFFFFNSPFPPEEYYGEEWGHSSSQLPHQYLALCLALSKCLQLNK